MSALKGSRRVRAVVARLSATLAVGVVAAAAGLGSAHAAVSPQTNFTLYRVDGNIGAYLLDARTYTGTPVTVTNSGLTSIGVSAGTGAAAGNTSIQAPTGGTLHVGSYDFTQFPDATHAGYSSDLELRACLAPTGTFTIHELTTAADGTIATLALSITTVCGADPAVVTEIRYHSTIDVVAYGPVPAGAAQADRTVTVSVPTATTFGTASIVGSPVSPAPFNIASDTCSGKTVPAGGTCTITVAAFASPIGALSAVLQVPSNNGAVVRVVPLSMVALNTDIGTYRAIAPTRMLDSRIALGTVGTSPFTAGQVRTVDVAPDQTGVCPFSAAVINLTVTQGTTLSYLTLYAAGTTRPVASNINFLAGWTGANLVTAPLNASCEVAIYNHAGSVHVVADVMGYYRTAALEQLGYADGAFQPVQSQRRIDTRDPGEGGPLLPQEYIMLPVDYGDELNPHIRALAVNVTAVQPEQNGFFTTFNGTDLPTPLTSALNFTPGKVVPNLSIVPISPCYDCYGDGRTLPMIGVANGSPGKTHLVVDLMGIFDDGTLADGWRFRGLAAPTRVADSRGTPGRLVQFGANVTQRLTVPAPAADLNTMAVVTNTVAINASSNTYVTLYEGGLTPRPGTSNINPSAGQTVANGTITMVSFPNDISIYNLAGTLDMAVDIAGTFELYPGLPDWYLTAAGAPTARSTGPQKNGTAALVAKKTAGAPTRGMATDLAAR